MHHVDMRHNLEKFSGDVRHGSSPGRGHAELARICFCIGDEFGECLRRKSRIDAQDDRLLGHDRDGCAVTDESIGELMVFAVAARKSV